MDVHIVYWHWIAFGLLLVLGEIFVPSFTIFWFGLGAALTGGLLWIFPELALSWQMFFWAIASCLFTLLWFMFIRPLMIDRTKAGIAKEAVAGESGQVIRVPHEGRRGIVRFTTPLLGTDEWEFICTEETEVGDRVFIKDVSGNTLMVEKR